jgi:hypothetical protein
MSVFTVDLKNKSGELARLCETMADRGINLVLSATARGEQGTVVLIADDEASAETVLKEADIGYTMRPALTIRMENQPGAGAATFRKLANAGVNADMLLPVRVSDDLFFAVVFVDDADKARRALAVQVIREGDFARKARQPARSATRQPPHPASSGSTRWQIPALAERCQRRRRGMIAR